MDFRQNTKMYLYKNLTSTNCSTYGIKRFDILEILNLNPPASYTNYTIAKIFMVKMSIVVIVSQALNLMGEMY